MNKHGNAHHEDMHTEPLNWTTLCNDASSSQTHALDAPLPNKSLVTQEKEYVMDVDCPDALYEMENNNYVGACPGYPESNASYSVVSTSPPTRSPRNGEAMYQSSSSPIVRFTGPCGGGKRVRDSHARNNFKIRKRVRPPSLPHSVSPSPSPPPPQLAARLRMPASHFKSRAKLKPKAGTPKISNINAYAFNGLSRQDAQDEEWSTLPRKKAKTRTYAAFFLF